MRFNVNIDGEPVPSVTWKFSGGAMDDVSVEDQDYLSKFGIIKATRKMAGEYTITATNINGTDSVTVKL